MKLLARAFCDPKTGKVWASSTDTDEGTRALWLHLEREGLVKRSTRSGRGILGHHFSYSITDEGRTAAEVAVKEANEIT